MAKLKRSALLAIQRLRRGKSPMKKQPIFFPQIINSLLSELRVGYTVEPLHSGHLGTDMSDRCREVVAVSGGSAVGILDAPQILNRIAYYKLPPHPITKRDRACMTNLSNNCNALGRVVLKWILCFNSSFFAT